MLASITLRCSGSDVRLSSASTSLKPIYPPLSVAKPRLGRGALPENPSASPLALRVVGSLQKDLDEESFQWVVARRPIEMFIREISKRDMFPIRGDHLARLRGPPCPIIGDHPPRRYAYALRRSDFQASTFWKALKNGCHVML